MFAGKDLGPLRNLVGCHFVLEKGGSSGETMPTTFFALFHA